MIRTVALLVLLVAGFPSSALADEIQIAQRTDAEQEALKERLLADVNRQRALNGARPVTLDRRLSMAAQKHSDDMARRDYFGHQSPDGRGMSDRLISAGYPWRVAAENVSAGISSPESTVSGWMTSPQHRQNLIDDNYIQVGIGYTERPPGQIKPRYSNYWTIVFAAPSR